MNSEKAQQRTLTDGDHYALITALTYPDDDCAHNWQPLFDEVERIIANRVAAVASGWQKTLATPAALSLPSGMPSPKADA